MDSVLLNQQFRLMHGRQAAARHTIACGYIVIANVAIFPFCYYYEINGSSNDDDKYRLEFEKKIWNGVNW